MHNRLTVFEFDLYRFPRKDNRHMFPVYRVVRVRRDNIVKRFYCIFKRHRFLSFLRSCKSHPGRQFPFVQLRILRNNH